MGFGQYKTFILIVVIAVSLLIASPTLQQLLVYPQTDYMTEFWLFGPNHDAAYPSNITADQNIRLYVDVVNHLGSDASYVIEVKFRNQTQSGPDSFNHTSSSLPALSSLKVEAAENAAEELPIDISFKYSINSDATRLEMQNITVNGVSLDASSITVAWDQQKAGFYGNVFFELWINNATTNSLQYHERYLSLWLKMNP